MKPVRLRLIDSKGKVVGHWFLRWNDDSASWSMSEWLPTHLGVEREDARTGKEPIDASTMLISRLFLLCEFGYQHYITQREMLRTAIARNLTVPGFRPGSLAKEAKTRLAALDVKFADFTTTYERAVPEEAEKVFKHGWPRVALPKFPWRIESPPTPPAQEVQHAP